MLMLNTLSACVTAYMMEKTSPKNATSFFFCRFDDQESLKATTIIGSISRQLVNDIPEDSFRAFDREMPIADSLEATLSKTRQYFIILDGLDECDEAQAQEVSKFLQSLLSFPHLHIRTFGCSRPHVLDWLPLKELSQQHISLESVESQGRIASDIGRFINITLLNGKRTFCNGHPAEYLASDINILSLGELSQESGKCFRKISRKMTQGINDLLIRHFLFQCQKL